MSILHATKQASQVAQWEKNLPAIQKTQELRIQTLGQGDLLEEGLATHSSILAWRIPGRLQSIGLQRVGHKVTEHTCTQAIQLGKKKRKEQSIDICYNVNEYYAE